MGVGTGTGTGTGVCRQQRSSERWVSSAAAVAPTLHCLCWLLTGMMGVGTGVGTGMGVGTWGQSYTNVQCQHDSSNSELLAHAAACVQAPHRRRDLQHHARIERMCSGTAARV